MKKVSLLLLTALIALLSVSAAQAQIYTLSYGAGTGGKIQTNYPQGAYDGGTLMIFTAVPDAGYVFVRWQITGSTLSNPATNVQVGFQITANTTLAAVFAPAATPTPSPSPSATPTPSPSPSPSPTPFPSPSPTPFPSPSPTPFPSPSPTPFPSPSPTPFSSPSPSPSPTPNRGTPAIDVGRKGNAGERFNATGGSFLLTGASVNVDEIRWNFLTGATTKVKISGSPWVVKISPLKTGTNTVQISGWNLTTNKGSKPINILIIRK